MDRHNLVIFLNISLIICLFSTTLVLPIFSVKAQTLSQYTTAQILENLKETEKAKVKGEIINIMGEMVNKIAEALEQLTLDFNIFFKLVPETEEELETATSTATTTATTTVATTTEEVDQSPTYTQSYGPEPQAPSIVCDPVAYGRQTYNVSTKNVPKISKIIVDPLDISFNASQDVIVDINDANGNPITSVTGIASTDTRTTSFTLSFTNGTTTSGTWQGSWTLKDSICMNFMITITASSNSGTSKVDVTFR